MTHETHCICNKRLKDKSQEMKCCYCHVHDDCEFTEEGKKIEESIDKIVVDNSRLSDVDQALQDEYFGQQCIKDWIDRWIMEITKAKCVNWQDTVKELKEKRKECDKRQDELKKLIAIEKPSGLTKFQEISYEDAIKLKNMEELESNTTYIIKN